MTSKKTKTLRQDAKSVKAREYQREYHRVYREKYRERLRLDNRLKKREQRAKAKKSYESARSVRI